MAFLETFSLFLLHDLPWKREDKEVRLHFERLWGHLRKGCLHFMRFVPGQHSWEHILTAQSELLAYGKLAEEVCTPYMLELSCGGVSRPWGPTPHLGLAPL